MEQRAETGLQSSRRAFVVGAGALAAASALSAASAFAEEGGHALWEPAWDAEADVVVVGFGAAGAAAAYAASQAGAEVIVLEKFDEDFAGGDSCVNLGFVGAVSDDWRQYVAHSGGTASPEKAQQLCDAAHRAVEWVAGMPGLVYEQGAVEGGAPAFYAGVSAYVAGLPGVRVSYETPACGLVRNPDTGDVVGVRAAALSGEVTVKARRGVVLATGDYASSPELLSQFHYPNLPIANVGGPGDTGDGLRMAASVGAQLGHLTNTSLDWAGAAFRKPSEELGCAFYYNYGGLMEPDDPLPAKIVVNRVGERFMNEETLLAGMQHNRNDADHAFLDVYSEGHSASGDYVNMPMFMVVDAKGFGTAPLLVNEGKGWRCKKGVYAWSEDNQVELERGWVLKADSLEELADLMASTTCMKGEDVTVDAAGLARTVEAYNEGCAVGEDAFGRTAFAALDTPPYYAVEPMPCLVYLEGGPVVDEGQRVMDWFDQPVGRLYAAGNVCMGGELMPFYLSGAMGMGLDAGAGAASLEDWGA